jgi:hypothetical protein
VEIIGGALRDRGFSDVVARRISQPQKQSTLAIYESKWQKFALWCGQRQIDPLLATVPQVAEFLLSLSVDDQLKPSTIDGYRSAIAITVKTVGALI